MRRSELSRKPKPKKCKWCQDTFTPTRMGQSVCKPFPCAVEHAKAKEEKNREKYAREQKRADRKRLEEMKTKPEITKEAQKEFNRYIRLRDHDKPCISCGMPTTAKEALTGGYWDCGHYRSVGSMPSLRFEPLNAHKQCKRCNRYLSGNVVEYRAGLIKRIGPDNLAWVEGPHSPKNYTRDQLREIRDYYRAEANKMAKKL